MAVTDDYSNSSTRVYAIFYNMEVSTVLSAHVVAKAFVNVRL